MTDFPADVQAQLRQRAEEAVEAIVIEATMQGGYSVQWPRTTMRPIIEAALAESYRLGAAAHVEAARQEPDDPLSVRLTSRLTVALNKAIHSGLNHFVIDHGRQLTADNMESAAKRVRGGIWSILKQHPDVRRVVGKFPDEKAAALEAARAECDTKARVMEARDADLARLREENEQERAAHLETARQFCLTADSQREQAAEIERQRQSITHLDTHLSRANSELARLKAEKESLFDALAGSEVACQQAEAALQTARAEWQLIKTVPQNVRVLVCRPTSLPMIASWSADHGWRKQGGGGFPLKDHQPTHWMPLPTPPGARADAMGDPGVKPDA